ncbi:MAG: A/G-specific adenine glycosylase [Alphaproteobacteria bacterium]|nr:A/G-specific adenine glycosylase [Alphaproteobacteria bacterium]
MNPAHPLSDQLLGWYDRNRRAFPWRALPGETPNPYRVWLSEIMLQQTGTASVIAYFNKFVARWPDVHALAGAELDAVLTQWAGLGYYARARNLHRCANIISSQMNGVFPQDRAALQKLPGIGPYTAAAITAIAYDAPAPVLDGNIERVMARLYAVKSPLRESRSKLRELSLALIACARPGDMAQAMMDLGATLCNPRAPACASCPWRDACRAHAQNMAESLPAMRPRRASQSRAGAVFWLQRNDGAVLLRRRPEQGLLGGMMEFPGTPWQEEIGGLEACMPAPCAWRELPGTVRHVFTHFRLELKVYVGEFQENTSVDGVWVKPGTFKDYALPAVMRKVAAHVQRSTEEPEA